MVAEQEYVGPPLVGVDSSWKIHSLESICDGVFDCPHSTPKLVDEGIFMVRTQDIRKGYFDTSNAVFVSQETYEERIKRAEPSPGDILFSREGTYFGDAAEIPPGTKVCLGQRMVLIRPKSKIIDPSFLRIWINSATFQNYLLAFRDGTVAERLNMSTVRTLPIPIPPLPEQKAIAHILGTLDDKIELNRRMNATLEGMAQALFKSWFVDFDPVIDNALAAGNPVPDELALRAEVRKNALGERSSSCVKSQKDGAGAPSLPEFPAAFQYTEEIGWIPKGWEVKGFGDLAQNVREGVDPTTLPAETPYVGLEHIDKQSLSLSRWGTAAEVDSQKSHFKPDDFLFGKLRPYFHKVCQVISEGICSTDILVIRPHQEDDAGYVGCQIFEPEFVEYANLRSTGTRMPRASWKDMAQYEVACPPDNLRKAFDALIKPTREKCSGAVIANQNLSKLRDTLLPKLISGELETI